MHLANQKACAIDGKKRVGMTAVIVYLKLNGVEPLPDSEEWERLVLDVASSSLDREATTVRMRKLLPADEKRKTRK
jgi:prophage maintenance system killer protein